SWSRFDIMLNFREMGQWPTINNTDIVSNLTTYKTQFVWSSITKDLGVIRSGTTQWQMQDSKVK
ncbi:Hypothetical predicted protein, partial [Prunus dulcis]